MNAWKSTAVNFIKATRYRHETHLPRPATSPFPNHPNASFSRLETAFEQFYNIVGQSEELIVPLDSLESVFIARPVSPHPQELAEGTYIGIRQYLLYSMGKPR